jgi:hypothetical protein
MDDEVRIRAMASYIVPYGGVTRVLDLGAGDQTLFKFLRGYTQYLPVDKVRPAGERESLICDFDTDPEMMMHFGRVHYAFCSGIIEYIKDLPRLFKVIGMMADNVILSYNIDKTVDRRANGWVNDLTLDQVIDLVCREYYSIDSAVLTLPGRREEVIISASHLGVWHKAGAPGCITRIPINEWRFMYDRESWEIFQREDPGVGK